MAGMKRCFVCYYHEIILKKNNRIFFEERLYRNVERALGDLPRGPLRRLSGRLLVNLTADSPMEEIGVRLQRVFGLVYCCPAWCSTQNMERLQEDLWELVRGQQFETFKIHARRANKKYPLTSPRINEIVGDFIRQKSGAKVRLRDPDLTCHVDIVQSYAFLYFQRSRGACGLPVSCSGKVVGLLSGGIDSPVAAFKVMKRGCRVVFAHFHSLPYTTRESLDKVRSLVAILNRYQYSAHIYMVPFADVQREIVAFTPLETRVIMYRRFMMRLAERIAYRERAQALVTGESIGQVASQTLENLRVISDACELPILRPLVGDDKEEIIDLARRIDTFPISILPEQDCCSLFVPRHPETRARLEGIRRIESGLEVDRMVEETLRRTEVEKTQFGGKKAPAVLSAES